METNPSARMPPESKRSQSSLRLRKATPHSAKTSPKNSDTRSRRCNVTTNHHLSHSDFGLQFDPTGGLAVGLQCLVEFGTQT